MRLPVLVAMLSLAFGSSAHADSASGHISYGAPDGLSVGLSLVSGRDSYFFDNNWGTDGAVFQLSAGTGGGRVSLGKGGVGFGVFGWAIKGTALHTWGHPVSGPPNAIYVGGEIQGSMLGRMSIGVLKSVSGPQGTPSVLVSATIGIGF